MPKFPHPDVAEAHGVAVILKRDGQAIFVRLIGGAAHVRREPACRAALAVRNLAPAATLGYFAAVQRAFYAEGRDVTRETNTSSKT